MNHDRRPPKSSDSGGQSTVPKDLQSIAEEPGAVARSSTLDSNDKGSASSAWSGCAAIGYRR